MLPGGEQVLKSAHGIRPGGVEQWHVGHTPLQADAGTLRLVRRGARLYYLFAAAGTAEFQVVDDRPVGTQDVARLRAVVQGLDRDGRGEVILETLRVHAAEVVEAEGN